MESWWFSWKDIKYKEKIKYLVIFIHILKFVSNLTNIISDLIPLVLYLYYNFYNFMKVENERAVRSFHLNPPQEWRFDLSVSFLIKEFLLVFLITLQGVLSTSGYKIGARTTGSSTVSWWTESESPSVDIDVRWSTDRKPCWYWIDTSLFFLRINTNSR